MEGPDALYLASSERAANAEWKAGLHATVGKKPALFRLLVEAAISGHNEAVPAEERDYVRAIRAEPDAARKLQIYGQRSAPFSRGLLPSFRCFKPQRPRIPI